MTHLANLIKLKANLTDEQAQLAAEAVMDHFKLKFPHILHAELDRVAEGGEFAIPCGRSSTTYAIRSKP
ncbi:hypothetical protein [Candidatus Pollutiaquabacter sp.]|uniref:hypothetical protein n=1 Tax=Candidatus Pollutiaquabacter sp. TaxID=3416354 RepID=UPI003C7F8074|nr:hypothetical protein [Bacteroidota bacterium]